MRRLTAVEEQPFEADPSDALAVYERLVRLAAELSPRRSFVDGSTSAPIIRNLVGTVQVSSGVVVEIAPKVPAGSDWQTAVIDMLTADRIHAGGQTPTASLARRSLADAFAHLYAEQLDRALRAAGPLQIIQLNPARKPALTGRLDVTGWLRTRVLAPHTFPQHTSMLTAENEFTRAFAWVALALTARVTDAGTRSRLLRLARDLRPGLAEHPSLDPGAAHRELPPQWREYAGAWATAVAVIRRISPLHREGTQEGLNLAVEPWPLLETLLHRSLVAAAQCGSVSGLNVSPAKKMTWPFLAPTANAEPRGVEPDGLLLVNGVPVASFEAKYSAPTPDRLRVHTFQAVTTAAAVGAPLAVLVYPHAMEPRVWLNVGATTPPGVIAAVGLDMYGYRRGTGEVERGNYLWELVAQHAGLIATTP